MTCSPMTDAAWDIECYCRISLKVTALLQPILSQHLPELVCSTESELKALDIRLRHLPDSPRTRRNGLRQYDLSHIWTRLLRSTNWDHVGDDGFLGMPEMDRKKEPQRVTEIAREVVKIRCSHCNVLNFETSARCTNCGAPL
jgi:hypothetical protein